MKSKKIRINAGALREREREREREQQLRRLIECTAQYATISAKKAAVRWEAQVS